MSSLAQFFPKLRRGWDALLNLGFGLLCLRFLFAGGYATDWTFVLLTGTSFVLAWWRPSASLFAVAVGFSLLSGLEKTVLLAPYSALLVVASSIWLGVFLRRPFPLIVEPTEPARDFTDHGSGWIPPLVDLLATLALLFLTFEIWGHRTAPGFWDQFWHQASFGTGAPCYFLTSGFLWLHGLFYFRAVRAYPGSGLLAPDGIKLAFLVNGIVLLLFFGVEWLCELPARWTSGFQSPYEDIATFGIMAACYLLLCLALMRRVFRLQTILLGLGAALLLVAVGASWSRGTWLATAVFVGGLAGLRLPRRVAILMPVTLIVAIVLMNVFAQRIPHVSQSGMERLMSLVRFEDPRLKTDRFDLYYKAAAMVRERPWSGHGIGSFYERATAYARPGDANAGMHQLPHNLLLQLAAEQGLLVAALFLCLVGAALWRGAKCWIARSREDIDPLSLLALGLTLMLGAYLQANLTWDMLLVHPTQPFFFWYLLAALWATTERAAAPLP